MIKQLLHKRFITLMLHDELSSIVCPWYVQDRISIQPIGNTYDSKHQRPECMCT